MKLHIILILYHDKYLTGTLEKWEKKVGDSCGPGDSIATIATDKASMSFDAQDDYFIAKLLVSDGEEVVVGVPIMITVEDESSVAAFANYVVPSKAAAPVVAAAPAAPAAPVVAAAPVHVSPPIVHAPAPVAVAAAPVAPAPVVTAPVVKASTITAHSSGPLPYSVRWSTGSVARSAIASKLSGDQQAYIAKYGRSGQKAL